MHRLTTHSKLDFRPRKSSFECVVRRCISVNVDRTCHRLVCCDCRGRNLERLQETAVQTAVSDRADRRIQRCHDVFRFDPRQWRKSLERCDRHIDGSRVAYSDVESRILAAREWDYDSARIRGDRGRNGSD